MRQLYAGKHGALPACGAPSISVGAADYTAQYDPRDIEDNRVSRRSPTSGS